jgi:hypothetical protein
MSGSPQPDELVRSRSHEGFCLGVAAVCVLFVIGFAVVGATNSDPVPQIVVGLIFVALTGVAIKWSRSCVVFDYSQDTLIVHNPLRTYRIALSDVYGFETHRSPFGNAQTGARRTLVDVKRKDGSRINCIGACALGQIAAMSMRGQLDAAYARRVREEGHREAGRRAR